MTIKKSKPYSIEGISFAGGKVNYDFQDNKLIGIKGLNSNNVFQPISRTSPDFQKAISGDNLSNVVRAYNIVKNGTNKDSYVNINDENTWPGSLPYEIASDEEINARYNSTYQSFLNAGFVDNNFDKPRPLAYPTPRAQLGKFVSDIMAYPLDISTEQDHFKITKYKYQRLSRNQSKPASKGESKETTVAGDSVKGSQLLGSILLPMPKATDVNGVEWGGSDLTISGLKALQAAEGMMDAGGALIDALNPLGDGANKFGKRLKDKEVQGDTLLKTEAQRRAAEAYKREGKINTGEGRGGFGQALVIQAATSASGLAFGTQLDTDVALGRTGGRVLNPNAEMLFQGPVIRDFTFSFVMIARSKREGDEIRRIVRFLKLGMAPKFQNTTFLSFPDIFQLEYKNGTGSDDILKTVNQFSPGGLALTTMNVDYAPNGYWSAYEDSQPVAMKMDLNFTELRPIYEGDQLNTPEDSVGF